MKYFTILILVLIISFFYVTLIDTVDEEYDIPVIEFNADTDIGTKVDKGHFLDKVEIDIPFNTEYVNMDSILGYFRHVKIQDSLVIDIPKKYKNENLFIKFSAKSGNSTGKVIISDHSVIKEIEVVPGQFKTYRENIRKGVSRLVIKSLKTEVFDLELFQVKPRRWNSKKKKTVIVFDIAGLNDSIVSDNGSISYLASLKTASKYFPVTYLLSPDERTSRRSFIDCLDPHLEFDKNGRYKHIQRIISDSLRNTSLPEVYKKAGYSTYLFSCNQNDTVFKHTFDNCYIFKEKPLSEITLSSIAFDHLINSDREENFYYLNLAGETDPTVYHKLIDALLKEFMFKIKNKASFKDYIFVFLSNSVSEFYKPSIAMIYTDKGIDPKEITESVKLTDIARTVLDYSGLNIPRYFSGLSLADDDKIRKRDVITASFSDTLFYNDKDTLYKKVKYSDKYRIIDLNDQRDITKFNKGINSIFDKKVEKYYSQDLVKYIILKNVTDRKRLTSFTLSSQSRFSAIGKVADYYSQKKKYRKFEKRFILEAEPGCIDTVLVFFRKNDQVFNYKFSSEVKLAYGPYSVNAGSVSDFREESEYGTDNMHVEHDEVFKDYDVKIFNRRVNY